MSVALKIHQLIKKVHTATGKEPCEIHMHPKTYKQLCQEMAGYLVTHVEMPSPLPKFCGVPLIVSSVCKKDLVYATTEPL